MGADLVGIGAAANVPLRRHAAEPAELTRTLPTATDFNAVRIARLLVTVTHPVNTATVCSRAAGTGPEPITLSTGHGVAGGPAGRRLARPFLSRAVTRSALIAVSTGTADAIGAEARLTLSTVVARLAIGLVPHTLMTDVAVRVRHTLVVVVAPGGADVAITPRVGGTGDGRAGLTGPATAGAGWRERSRGATGAPAAGPLMARLRGADVGLASGLLAGIGRLRAVLRAAGNRVATGIGHGAAIGVVRAGRRRAAADARGASSTAGHPGPGAWRAGAAPGAAGGVIIDVTLGHVSPEHP